MEREDSDERRRYESKLYDIGFACGKMAEDISRLFSLDKILVVVPLRGGLPISKGVVYGLDKIARASETFETSPIPETDVVYVPASSIVKDRNEVIENLVSDRINRMYGERGYKAIVVLDEAISGSSSNMVFSAVKNSVKNCKEDKNWKRFYWKELPIHLFIVSAYNGYKLEPSIQKLSNVLIYPIEGNIITTDNSKIYPLEYWNVVGRRTSTKNGKEYNVVEPDILFFNNEKWDKTVEGIEKGVDGYFKQKT